MKRVFLIVLDSFGIGAAPDAADFGDEGVNTLRSIAATGTLDIPNLLKLGLGNIEGVDAIEGAEKPLASVARLRELSRGKDTTTGHWEIAGKISEKAMPTYPNGFPKEVISAFEAAVGRKVICNLPYSGTDVIRDFGEEHVKTGNLIVYTSADSVFQIAAHEEVVPIEELYDICRTARELLQGEHGVGRVIARPFEGTAPDFKRTGNRRDFSLEPPYGTMNDRLKEAGLDVIGVGKIGDIFASVGLTESYPSHGNAEGMQITSELLERDFHGFCFVNLVDFDMLYGHRQNIDGYAAALTEFDGWLGGALEKLGDGDILMISADHGCDPGDASTDHTREYIPLLVYGKGIKPENLGTVNGFYNVGELVLDVFGIDHERLGEKIADRLI